MARAGGRASRRLVVLVICIIVIGGGIYLWRHRAAGSSTVATAQAAESPRAAAPVVRPPATHDAARSRIQSAPLHAPAALAPSSRPAPVALGGASALVPPATTAPATRTAPIAATTRSQASASVLDGSGAVAGVKTKLDAGDVLAARHLLTAALQSSQLADADATGIKQQVSQINETVLFSSRRFADDEFGGTYTVKPGDRLTSIAAQYQVTWDLLASLNGISDPKRMKAGQTLKVIRGPFHALVHKRRFTLELYLGAPPGETGSVFVTSFPVGLGKDDSTPTGTWMVQPSGKLRKPKFWGAPGLPPREGDDPENPLGPFWIGLSGTDGHAVGKIGYGIHGTSEPDSIGKQSSLGCIRMHNEDVARVFQLLVESKSIVVVED